MSTKAKKKYKTARPYESVGRGLATARIAAGLSQREVSLKLKYSSAQFISNFERGIALPPLAKLKTLIDLYGLDGHGFADIYAEAERTRVLEGLELA